MQRWGWFSLNYYAFDPAHPQGPGLNGNLFDHGSGTMTPLGRAFGGYLRYLRTTMVDLALEERPGQLRVVNRGETVAQGWQLHLWWGKTLVGTVTHPHPLPPGCGSAAGWPVQWQSSDGSHPALLHATVAPLPPQVEYDSTDNRGWLPLSAPLRP